MLRRSTIVRRAHARRLEQERITIISKHPSKRAERHEETITILAGEKTAKPRRSLCERGKNQVPIRKTLRTRNLNDRIDGAR